jgi:hypothetical protein
MSFITLQLRRDTAANWTAANPTLASGEFGLETDTTLFKIGDGATAWNALSYGGIQGTPGTQLLNGAVDPTTEGVNGDFYLNTATSTIFGPKAAGTWPSGVSIIGAPGADGADGIGVPVGGTTGQALIKSSNTDYATEWGTVASSPGGSDTQVQFNDGGVFGGDAGLTFNKTSKALTLGGGTVTTSSPVIDAAQTWDAGGVTFTGLKANFTDTASAAGSLLMDLQVGGASRFSVRKDGFSFNYLNATDYTISSPARLFGGFLNSLGRSTTIIFDDGSGNGTGQGLVTGANGSIRWQSQNRTDAGGSDTILSRRAAANLRLGAADVAAPVAQTLSVQSVVAGTTNTAGADLTITGSQGTGTGAGGSIVFQVAPAGSSGTAQNALATALTINADRSVQIGGVGPALGGISSTWLMLYNAPTTGGYSMAFSTTGNVSLQPGGTLEWAASFASGTPDVRLFRDAANTLALRNGTAAQALRVYNTFTSATDFERGNIFWDSNVLKIGTEKGSAGGTARALEFQTDGVTRLTIASTGAATFAGAVSTGASNISNNASVLTNQVLFLTNTLGLNWSSSTQVIAPSNGVLSLYNQAKSDFDRLQFGGTTSSFPALKRSTTTLQARLADDSAFTNIQGKLTTETAYTAGAPTATGYLVLYDSNGTAYKVAAEAL